MDYEEIAILKKERKKKGYDSLDGIILVMNRGGGTCQVINLIHHIMPQELEPGIPEMVHQILPPPGEEDADDDDIVPPLQQLVHQVVPTNPAPVTMIRRGCRRPAARGRRRGSCGRSEARARRRRLGWRRKKEVAMRTPTRTKRRRCSFRG